MPERVLEIKVFNYPQIDYYTADNNGQRVITNVIVLGQEYLAYTKYVPIPDSFDVSEISLERTWPPGLLEYILGSGIDLISLTGGYNTLIKIFLGVATEYFTEIFADEIVYTVLNLDLIKTQNFSLSLKGDVDVKTQMGLDGNDSIWLWRVYFSVLSFDPRVVDVQYNNPDRFYFGLLSFSNFGSFYSPYWLRTKEHYAGEFQVTPNATGKDSGDNVGFPNLQYNYSRRTGFSFDLRKSVLVQAKVSAVRFLSDVSNWW